VLDGLDRFVVRIPAARHATLAYAELDLDTGRLRYACAGHMPPLLAQADEPPGLLWEGRSPPLGVRLAPAPWSRREAEVTLLPEARLLLYTDGLWNGGPARSTRGSPVSRPSSPAARTLGGAGSSRRSPARWSSAPRTTTSACSR
jgi:serine phosphatase RsbU (regulator of sigma subunit)